jgi:hypothetical protein
MTESIAFPLLTRCWFRKEDGVDWFENPVIKGDVEVAVQVKKVALTLEVRWMLVLSWEQMIS